MVRTAPTKPRPGKGFVTSTSSAKSKTADEIAPADQIIDRAAVETPPQSLPTSEAATGKRAPKPVQGEPTKKENVTFSIDPELLPAIDAIAEDQERSRSWVVNKALRRAFLNK